MTLEERLALNQAVFRVANERMLAWPEERSRPPDEPLSIFCECSHEDCRRKLRVDRPTYEAVRTNSRHFLVAVGHDQPKVEHVVDQNELYAVVEKIEQVAPVLLGTDPRRAPR